MVFQYVILFNSDRELATTIHEASYKRTIIFPTKSFMMLLSKYLIVGFRCQKVLFKVVLSHYTKTSFFIPSSDIKKL